MVQARSTIPSSPHNNTSIGNAKPFKKRNLASVFTKEIKNRIGSPYAEGKMVFVLVLFLKMEP